MHLGFTFGNTALEVCSIPRHSYDRYYGKHPDKPSYVLIASMARPGMFPVIITSLETLRTPAKVGKELFEGRKAVDIFSSRLG